LHKDLQADIGKLARKATPANAVSMKNCLLKDNYVKLLYQSGKQSCITFFIKTLPFKDS
jgi:hypothetical protein